MSEVINEQKEKKAEDPFIRLDRCQAIVNDLDYDSNGRLTYMPFNGVDCEQGKDNKIISTPDAYSTALAYTDWCVKAINTAIFNINPNVQEGFARVALSNIDYILTERLSQEVGTAIITVFDFVLFD